MPIDYDIQVQAAVAHCAQALLRANVAAGERNAFLATVLEEFRVRIGVAHIALQHCYQIQQGWWYRSIVQMPDPTVSRSGTPITELNPALWANIQAGIPYSAPSMQIFRDGSPNHGYWQRRSIARIDLFPIIIREQLWGSVHFGSLAPYQPIRPEELAMLGSLADMIGAFISRIESHAALERQLTFDRALAQCSHILLVEGANTTNWATPVQQALATIRMAVGCNRVGLNVYQSPGEFALPTWNIFDQATDTPPTQNMTVNSHEIPAAIINTIAHGGWIGGTPQELFPAGTTPLAFFELNGVQSLQITGFHIHGEWRGHLIVSDHRESWVWDEPAIQVIQTGIEMIAAFVQQQELREALVRARDAAEAADAAKSTFLATMSHEIRTPLNAVLGMAELLLETELLPDQRAFTGTITTAGRALLAIINSILDFSRGDSGYLELEMQPFDLHGCLANALDLVAHEAHHKGLRITCQVAADVPHAVIGDMPRLRQVLLNLLSNAVKFTEHGAIVLSAITTPIADDQQQVTITVCDSGIGMNPTQLAHVFEPFVQADSSTTRRYGGTGLGLAICQQLVQLMGGEITVVSERGVGSIFSISILFRTPRPVISDPHPSIVLNTAMIKPLHILVAEDNPINQEITQHLLNRLGHTVAIVASGRAALNAIEQEPYDVVLMDIHMPELDGEQATRQIRSRGAAVHQPYIIALTANAFAGDQERFREAGMNDTLSKPVQLADLQRALANVPIRPLVALPIPEPEPIALIDWTILHRLLASLGATGPETIAIAIQLFERACPQQLDALDSAIARNDQAQVHGCVHQLRGGCLQIGAQGLADLGQQISHSSDTSVQAMLATKLRACYAETLSALQHMHV
jgi:signal transduction histidine kinase/HPt (histidine-containing phosphotransfer) domain-containing protein